MRRYVALTVFVLMAIGVHAQLPNRAKKMAGTWEYKLNSGFEVLELKGEEIVGVGYRINRKTGDTSCVETTRIQKVNKTLVLSMTTYKVVHDSVVPTTQKLIGWGNKLTFDNISSPAPHSIKYSFGFLNRNKLFIRVYHRADAEPVKLTLTRKKKV